MSSKAIANQAKCLSTSLLRRLLANQLVFSSGGGRARVVAHVLQTKAIGRAVIAIREKDCLDVGNMTFETLTSASTNYWYPE